MLLEQKELPPVQHSVPDGSRSFFLCWVFIALCGLLIPGLLSLRSTGSGSAGQPWQLTGSRAQSQ